MDTRTVPVTGGAAACSNTTSARAPVGKPVLLTLSGGGLLKSKLPKVMV